MYCFPRVQQHNAGNVTSRSDLLFELQSPLLAEDPRVSVRSLKRICIEILFSNLLVCELSSVSPCKIWRRQDDHRLTTSKLCGHLSNQLAGTLCLGNDYVNPSPKSRQRRGWSPSTVIVRAGTPFKIPTLASLSVSANGFRHSTSSTQTGCPHSALISPALAPNYAFHRVATHTPFLGGTRAVLWLEPKGLTISQLLAWNPNLKVRCGNLRSLKGYVICLSEPGTVPNNTVTPLFLVISRQ
jgi:hypothetical protein